MSLVPRKPRRMLAALLALAEPCAGAAGAAVVTGAAVLLSASRAEAQTAWGMSRRTARRTSRRTTRRNLYYGYGGAATPYVTAMPPGYQTVVIGGATYYEAEGVRYEPMIVEGQTVYVQVQ